MAQISFEDALKALSEREGSDLYYSTGAPPSAKIFGKLEPLSDEIMKPGEIDVIAQDIMDDAQKEKFAEVPEPRRQKVRALPPAVAAHRFGDARCGANGALRPAAAVEVRAEPRDEGVRDAILARAELELRLALEGGRLLGVELQAQRDLRDLGCHVAVHDGAQELDRGTLGLGMAKGLKEGVLFSTYATLVSAGAQKQKGKSRLQQLVENSEYVGVRPKRVTEQRTINPADPKIKQDIIRMILQYLQEEGYAASFVTIQDETNVKLAEQRPTLMVDEEERQRQKHADGRAAVCPGACGKGGQRGEQRGGEADL